MSIFNHQPISQDIFNMDIDRIRRGIYTDQYFTNFVHILKNAAETGYTFQGSRHNLPRGLSSDGIKTGDMEVEMQWFTRRRGNTIVVGVDFALCMMQECAGYWEKDTFISAYKDLDVWAIEDGDTVQYEGNPEKIQPVLRVRGKYRTFAHLETPILGILTRSSRVATNVYNILEKAHGKPVLFFPARFDLYENQAADGYAYSLAIQRYNQDTGNNLKPYISTDAQGAWWRGHAAGTVPHAGIACFLGDIAETMLVFARTLPADIPRIALVDFNNNSIRDSLSACQTLFREYQRLMEAGDRAEAEKFVLYGVRLDTSESLRDQSLPAGEDPSQYLGVNPTLVHLVRDALDNAWRTWGMQPEWEAHAKEYCQRVKIIVSGGFNEEKIFYFESKHVPVDLYAVGSSFFNNYRATNTDFTADVVRVNVHGEWIPMAKTGRAPGENPNLHLISKRNLHFPGG